MSALGGPRVPLGHAAAAAAAAAGVPAAPAGGPAAPAGGPPPPPAAAAVGPRDFNMAVVLAPLGAALGFAVPGYELPWENYNRLLRENLTEEYRVPAARVPAPPPPAAAPAPGGDPVAAELLRIKAYLNDPDHADRRPPVMNRGEVNALVNRAKESPQVAALGRAAPFDVDAYRVAVLAHLNTNPGGFNFASVGP